MPRRNKRLRTQCPFEAAMDIIGSKWKGAILFELMKGTRRFSELKAAIPAITQRMLSQQLRALEADKLISRKVYAQIPPKVEYSLTKVGRSLEPAFTKLIEWGKQFTCNL
jgi:DNA-binding HxlR family transcriptional regulator